MSTDEREDHGVAPGPAMSPRPSIVLRPVRTLVDEPLHRPYGIGVRRNPGETGGGNHVTKGCSIAVHLAVERASLDVEQLNER